MKSISFSLDFIKMLGTATVYGRKPNVLLPLFKSRSLVINAQGFMYLTL